MVRLIRGMGIGIIFGFLFVACAAFQYRHYTLEASSYEGKLKGPMEADDLPFSLCQPTDQDLAPCFLYLRAEHERLVTDYEILKVELKECQSKLP